jgi:hypothetical protein
MRDEFFKKLCQILWTLCVALCFLLMFSEIRFMNNNHRATPGFCFCGKLGNDVLKTCGTAFKPRT